MGNKTKIDWCDSTWNPISGCLYGCKYCYARGIAKRFGTLHKCDILPEDEGLTFAPDTPETFCVLDKPVRSAAGRIEPYPADFLPTFHRYKLNEYETKERRNIFVCSMADMFGDWVPEEWIKEVFEACKAAPQHNYIFLTKNPARYLKLERSGIMPHNDNMWFGTSVTNPNMWYAWFGGDRKFHWFLSIEPLLADMGKTGMESVPEWVIIGAETGNRKEKVVPEKSWVDNIVSQCKERNIPVFMKDSLRGLYGDNLITEYPPGLSRLAHG